MIEGSFMSRMSMLEQIANDNNLRNAWIKTSYHARTSLEYFDKYAYDEFEENIDSNLAIIRHQLLKHEYKFGDLRIFEIPKGDDKRKIYFLSPSDGIVSQAIINVIAPLFESQFSTHSFGNRISYSTSESKNPFLEWQYQYTKYINNILSMLELAPSYWYQITDVTNFYPSINKQKLLAKIAIKINDAGVLRLIEEILHLKAINSTESIEEIPGLPPGTIYSHFLANLYLDDFDKFMEQSTDGYVRYVDDMCFAVDSEESLKRINQQIATFLEGLGLVLKERKTEAHQIINPEYLIEHTRKMKYDLRFGVIESLRDSSDLGEVQVTEMVFHDLFMRVEKEDDISKIADETAGFLAAGFDELLIESQLAVNIAYGVLLRNPQRISAIRALLGYLMKVSADNPDDRFIKLVSEGSNIVKISFLQLLLGYSAPNETYVELASTIAAQSDNYLIRASAYTTLESLRIGISINEFRRLSEEEESDFVLARLVQCVAISNIEDAFWTDFRQILETKNRLILNAIIYVAHKISYKDDSWIGTEILLPVFLSHPSCDIFSLAFLLRLVSQFSNYDALKQVHEVIIKENVDLAETLLTLSTGNTFIFLAKRKNDYEKLSVYIDSLRKLKIPADYSAGYQEILMGSSDERLVSEVKSVASEVISSTSLPDWYREKMWDVDKGPYCDYLFQSNYTCREFQDGERHGVLEKIPVDLILASRQFSSINEWFNYLRGLDKAETIKLIDLGLFDENGIQKVFVVYEIEAGFNSIRQWMNLNPSLLNENSVIDILIKTVEKLEATKLSREFYFQSINPCNVLWNPQGEIKLLNVGSTLLSPRYVCGSLSCNTKYHDNEVGPTVGIYYLGLLAVQIIEKDDCPVLNLELSNKPNKKKFYENNGITPHLKSVIARMVQQKTSYRYGDLSSLKRDLIQAAEFLKKRKEVPDDKQKLLGRLTLVDYLDFRFEIAERAPDIPNDSLQKANLILEEISKQIHFYSDKETVKALFAYSSRAPFVNPAFWYWLSPESRILIALAFDWESLINELNEQLNLKYQNKLSNMLLGRVVYFEALAAIQGLLIYGSSNRIITKSFGDDLSAIVQHENYSELRIKAPLDKASQPLPNPYSKEDVNPIINLFQFVDGNNWIIMLRRLSTKSIFSGIGLSRHEIDFFLPNQTKVFTTKPLFKANKFSSRTWLVHKLPYKFIENISSKSDETPDLMWEDVTKILGYLRSMNPCKRGRGKLIDFIPVATPRQGNISFGWSWASFSPVEATFTEDRVLTLGNLITTRGKQKAVQIDLLDKAKTISSIFSYPSIFSNLKSSSRMGFESSIAYGMKKNRWVAWILAVVLAILEIAIASSFWQTLSLGGQIISGSLIVLFTRLIINPLWKKVEDQLAIIRPEDRVLEIT